MMIKLVEILMNSGCKWKLVSVANQWEPGLATLHVKILKTDFENIASCDDWTTGEMGNCEGTEKLKL